jgi:hypothetical protein
MRYPYRSILLENVFLVYDAVNVRVKDSLPGLVQSLRTDI